MKAVKGLDNVQDFLLESACRTGINMMATYKQMKEALEKDEASEYDGGRSAFIVERIIHIWRCLGEPSKNRFLCFK